MRMKFKLLKISEKPALSLVVTISYSHKIMHITQNPTSLDLHH